MLLNITRPLGVIDNHVIPQFPMLMRSHPSGGNCNALEYEHIAFKKLVYHIYIYISYRVNYLRNNTWMQRK